VAAGEAGVPEAFIEKLQAVPQVRAASPVIEALAETDVAATRLLIVGLDITGDAAMQPWLFRTGEGSAEVDPIAFIAQPDSLLMTRSFAAAHGWAIGSKLGLHTVDGVKAFTVRGLLSDESLEKIYGGNVAVMDVYGAQHVFGRGSTVDRIEIALTDGAALEDGRAAIRSVVGPGYTVDPPSARGEQFEDLVKSYQTLYPKMRMVGADFAAPWRGLLWKVETAYIDAVSPHVTSAWTYAVQAEKTGDKLTQAKRPDTLDLDRATRDSVSGHVAWNPNPRQTVSAEWFVHPSGKAFVTRLLYSRNLYSTFRAIARFLWIGGSQSDPLARYNVDSYLTLQLRYSF
jgi:hypothetical protein